MLQESGTCSLGQSQADFCLSRSELDLYNVRIGNEGTLVGRESSQDDVHDVRDQVGSVGDGYFQYVWFWILCHGRAINPVSVPNINTTPPSGTESMPLIAKSPSSAMDSQRMPDDQTPEGVKPEERRRVDIAGQHTPRLEP
jgi:hypothetical protein